MTPPPSQPTPAAMSGQEDPLSTRTGLPGIAELHSAATAAATPAPSTTRRSQGDEVYQKSPEEVALRRQAEAHLAREPGPLVQTDQAAPSGAEAQRLIHELQVHQVELELQNQTLLETRRQLEQSLENYTDLYDFAPVAYVTVTGDGTIREINLAGAALLGQPRAELVQRRFALSLAPPSRVVFSEFLDRVVTGVGKQRCELDIAGVDGPPCPTMPRRVQVEGLRATPADVLLCRMVLIDITERKQAQAELELYRQHLEALVESRTRELIGAREVAESANQAKSNFLAHMTHELRTPLHAILGFTEVLIQLEDRRGDAALEPVGVGDAVRRGEALATIHRNGLHLLSLVNDILDFSRMECGHLDLEVRPTDLHTLLRECHDDLAQLAADKGLALHLELAPGLPTWVQVDGRRLKQVLNNLLGNAVKFTRHGEVRLLAAAAAGHGAAAPVELRFTVADTGPGIPDTDQERIFTVFVQSAPGPSDKATQGSGLGLTISRQLARQMGGEIRLDSAPGVGSRFTLTLPAVALADQADDRPPMAVRRDAGPGRTDLICSPLTTAAGPPPAPPPLPALLELRELAELGRTSRLEAWCRYWSVPGRRPAFAAQVLKLTKVFEHERLRVLVDARIADHPGDQE